MRNPDFPPTDRELEIMRTLVECHGSTKDAARKLFLSRSTVRNYRTEIYAKLGARTFTEALTILGWIRLPPPRRR